MSSFSNDETALQVPMLFSKIHRATVTDAVLGYEGSLSIDASLMQLAELLPFQQIQVYNIHSGDRFETYAIVAPAGSGTIQINGAAARLAQKGDLVIIASYVHLPAAQARHGWKPRVLLVDGQNRPLPSPSALAD